MQPRKQCDDGDPCGPECFADGAAKELKPKEVPYVNTREGCQHKWEILTDAPSWHCPHCGQSDFF